MRIACSQKRERERKEELKCIHGFGKTGREMLEASGLETLENRRILALKKFRDWFPKRENVRHLRSEKPYLEENARCNETDPE